MVFYVIENLEPKLSRWVLIEYDWISQNVGKRNIIFTNVKTRFDKLQKSGECHDESVSELDFQNGCILDPQAEKILTPSEAKKFDYFIFGGILGNNPVEGRTKKWLTSKMEGKCEVRNLGSKQFSTDTAVLVTKMIFDGTPLEKIQFQDPLIIETGLNEEVELPYPYVLKNGKPVVAPKLVEMLKKQKGF